MRCRQPPSGWWWTGYNQARSGHSVFDVRFRGINRRAGLPLATSGYSHKRTFVRQIERGFDFLGYHFGPEGFTVGAKTIKQFVARAIRLYEQEPGGCLCPVWIVRVPVGQVGRRRSAKIRSPARDAPL